jgi:hypothetical protein
MTESDVVAIASSWLKANGWTVRRARHRGPGIDIEAQKNGRSWLIEAKGDARSDKANQDLNFYGALGQIVAYRSDASAKYSVALPDLPHYRNRWAKLPRAARTVVDTCIFVSGAQRVSESSWPWP